MKRIAVLVACVVLAGCATPRLTTEAAVQASLAERDIQYGAEQMHRQTAALLAELDAIKTAQATRVYEQKMDVARQYPTPALAANRAKAVTITYLTDLRNVEEDIARESYVAETWREAISINASRGRQIVYQFEAADKDRANLKSKIAADAGTLLATGAEALSAREALKKEERAAREEVKRQAPEPIHHEEPALAPAPVVAE